MQNKPTDTDIFFGFIIIFCMITLAIIFIIKSEAKAEYKTTTLYTLTCERVSPYTNRCENNEVFCYESWKAGLQCFQK